MTTDEQASTWAGEPLEDLAGLTGGRGEQRDGPVVPDAALDLVARADRRGRVPRDASGSPEAQALRAAGLLDDGRALTPFGHAVRDHWRAGVTFLEAHARGEQPGRLTAWPSSRSLLVAASAGADESPVPAGHVRLGVVPTSRFVSYLAAWAGVRPAWSFDLGPWELPRADYEARLSPSADALPEPPPGTGERAARLWREPWTEIVTVTPQSSLRFVVAGTAGALRVDVRDDLVALAVLPPRLLFLTLVAQTGAAVQGR